MLRKEVGPMNSECIGLAELLQIKEERKADKLAVKTPKKIVNQDIWNEDEVEDHLDLDPRAAPEYSIILQQNVSSEDLYLGMSGKLLRIRNDSASHSNSQGRALLQEMRIPFSSKFIYRAPLLVRFPRIWIKKVLRLQLVPFDFFFPLRERSEIRKRLLNGSKTLTPSR